MQQTQNETKNATQEKGHAEAKTSPLARLRLLYESADRRMCLFEDADGHLVAVPSSHLA